MYFNCNRTSPYKNKQTHDKLQIQKLFQTNVQKKSVENEWDCMFL